MPQRYNFQRYSKDVTVADGQTVGTATTDNLNGKLAGILLNVPQLTGTTTITFEILDADGFTIFSRASIAENGKTSIFTDSNNHPLRLPLAGIYTLRVTQTNAQSGAAAVTTAKLLVDRG